MHIRSLLLAALLAGTSAVPAAATVYTATFTTAVSGVDETSYFGGPRRLDAQAATVRTVYDSAAGVRNDGADFIRLQGGTSNGSASFILGSELTINGRTLAFQARDLQTAVVRAGSAGQFAFGTEDMRYFGAPNPAEAPASRDALTVSASGPSFAATFDQPGTYAVTNYAGSFLGYRVTDATFANFAYNLTLNFGGPGTLTVVPGAGAVPEPSAWATMALGFGLVGAAARGRRERRTA